MNEASFAHILFATRVPRKPIRHTQAVSFVERPRPLGRGASHSTPEEPEVDCLWVQPKDRVVGAGFAGLYTVFFS